MDVSEDEGELLSMEMTVWGCAGVDEDSFGGEDNDRCEAALGSICVERSGNAAPAGDGVVQRLKYLRK